MPKWIGYDFGHAHSGLKMMHFYVAVYEEFVIMNIIKDIMYIGRRHQFNEVAGCGCRLCGNRGQGGAGSGYSQLARHLREGAEISTMRKMLVVVRYTK